MLHKWDAPAAEPGLEHVTISVSGARGGHTVDFRQLAEQGAALVGMTDAFADGVLRFAPDLGDNLARGDAYYLSVLDEADDYVARHGLDLPAEPEARIIGPQPRCVTDPMLELDLHAQGVTSIVWATGYRVDFGWLKVGRPRRGRPARAPPRHLGGSGYLLPRSAVADPEGLVVHLRRVAGRQAPRGPHRLAAQLPDPRRRRPAVPRGVTAVTTHRRIRPFNTRDTYPNQRLDNDLCHAVVANGTVYLRGQVGTDFEGNLVGLGDPAAQADQAMANVAQLLAEAGSDLSHIVKTTIYITDPRYREPVYQTVGRWLRGVHPVSTGLVVSALAQPEWLIEIDVIAVIPL